MTRTREYQPRTAAETPTPFKMRNIFDGDRILARV
jgi:hypothetical protein